MGSGWDPGPASRWLRTSRHIRHLGSSYTSHHSIGNHHGASNYTRHHSIGYYDNDRPAGLD